MSNSSLYNSQIKLVESLNNQNINEKLVNYDIYAIKYDYYKKQYKVYVVEEVGIKYPDKDFVNKKFRWCYTVEENILKLSEIKEW